MVAQASRTRMFAEECVGGFSAGLKRGGQGGELGAIRSSPHVCRSPRSLVCEQALEPPALRGEEPTRRHARGAGVSGGIGRPDRLQPGGESQLWQKHARLRAGYLLSVTSRSEPTCPRRGAQRRFGVYTPRGAGAQRGAVPSKLNDVNRFPNHSG